MTFDWTISVPVLISVFGVVYAHFRTRNSDVDARFKAGSERMDRFQQRIQTLEERSAAAPGMAELHRIELQIATMAGAMGRVEATMHGNAQIMQRLETIVSRHEDHLLGTKR